MDNLEFQKLFFLPLVMCCLLLWQLGKLFLKSFLFQSCNIRVAHDFAATTDKLYQFTKGVKKWPKCV